MNGCKDRILFWKAAKLLETGFQTRLKIHHVWIMAKYIFICSTHFCLASFNTLYLHQSPLPYSLIWYSSTLLSDWGWYSMHASGWPYRLLIIYIGWFTAFPWAPKGTPRLYWCLQSILISWCHTTLLLDILISPCIHQYLSSIISIKISEEKVKIDARKSQKGKKKDEEKRMLERSLPGRERCRTEADDILLNGISVFVGRSKAASRT